MKKWVVLVGVLFPMLGCGQIDTYDPSFPPTCYELDGAIFHADVEVDCPPPESVHGAIVEAVSLAEVPVRLNGFNIIYSVQETFKTDPESVGVIYIDHAEIYIANIDYREAILRHEVFHFVKYRETGHIDVNHEDLRWDQVN